MKVDPFFQRYIGIDYSGGDRPTSANSGIRVFTANAGQPPKQERRPDNNVNTTCLR